MLPHRVPRSSLCATGARIYGGEKIPAERETLVIICDEKTIRPLNRKYRGKDQVTDVLSFPFKDPDLLGEIYICLPRAVEQAREYGFCIRTELLRLLVHGMIHLLGHDHHTRSQRLAMEAIERKYLPDF